MEVRRDPPYEGPIPQPDGTERPFYEAAARGELVFQRCPSCGQAQFYPRAACTACGVDPVFERAAGRGVVHTFTIVRQMGARPFRDRVPYVVAMVELPEGVRMMGNVTDCAPDDVHVGMELEAYAVPFDEGLAIPFWRPAGRAGS